jgi:hypothetical protein
MPGRRKSTKKRSARAPSQSRRWSLDKAKDELRKLYGR